MKTINQLNKILYKSGVPQYLSIDYAPQSVLRVINLLPKDEAAKIRRIYDVDVTHSRFPNEVQFQMDIEYFSGTENWYHTTNPHVLFTDGVKYIADRMGAYWLIDLIASYQSSSFKIEPFQVWQLEMKTLSQAEITADDGNGNTIARQHIPHTDFPMRSVKLYLEYDGEHSVIMLPGER